MENPYWHEDYKPHLVDKAELKILCFDINNIVTASASQQGSGEVLEEGEEKPGFSFIERLMYEMAEAELSKKLLRLALLVRTFDDTLLRSDVADEYSSYKKEIEERNNGFGVTFEGKDGQTNTIRECCNKIIHADDVRPVYDTDDDRDDPKARWGMDGTLELEGEQGKTVWRISIFIIDLIEAILELIDYQK
ncbi:hypothetical protein [Rhizobium rhizosphaerae]|uniref:hypothetical protein n=1 Tax=Xaviernesmea rhizosphaerae TaxID=1672749 RepID=UPI000B0D29CB|nr:hypothetical protein [Xaviernesmea rhizosphaerae]